MNFIILCSILISYVGAEDSTIHIIHENIGVPGKPTQYYPKTYKKIEDKWFSEDKLHHFAYSFGITGLTYHIYHCQFHNPKSEAQLFSISLASTAGIGKELYDRYCKKKKISYKDLVVDALGISLASLLLTIH